MVHSTSTPQQRFSSFSYKIGADLVRRLLNTIDIQATWSVSKCITE